MESVQVAIFVRRALPRVALACLMWCGGGWTTSPLRAQDGGPVLLSRTGGGGAGWSNVVELTAAADKGNPKARAQLGEMLLRGEDIAKDVPRALVLLEQAARDGDASAAFRIGMLLEEGAVVPRDQARAVGYLRAAAIGGIADAFRNVGVAYSTGRGVKRDYAEALAWLILAQKLEPTSTVADELRTYLTKVRRPEIIAAGERRAPLLAQELEQTTVAKALPSPAPLGVGGVSASPGTDEDGLPVKLIAPTGRVFRWPNVTALQRAADQGNTDALAALGQVLLEGKLLDEDTRRAVTLLERAAQAGSPDAAQHLAELYAKGTKYPRDETKAFTYTLQAARGGVRTAAHNLGALYANGTGTKANYTEALAWLLVAQHFKIDAGQAKRIRDYLVKTDAKQIPLAERAAAARVKEIETVRAGYTDF